MKRQLKELPFHLMAKNSNKKYFAEGLDFDRRAL